MIHTCLRWFVSVNREKLTNDQTIHDRKSFNGKRCIYHSWTNVNHQYIEIEISITYVVGPKLPGAQYCWSCWSESVISFSVPACIRCAEISWFGAHQGQFDMESSLPKSVASLTESFRFFGAHELTTTILFWFFFRVLGAHELSWISFRFSGAHELTPAILLQISFRFLGAHGLSRAIYDSAILFRIFFQQSVTIVTQHVLGTKYV